MRFALGAVVVTALVVTACQAEEERALTSSERQLVSQRYADTVRVLTPIVDSLCDVQQKSLIAAYTDSLYQGRLVDLKAQRKPYGL